MKRILSKITYILSFAFVLQSTTSCEVFGLDYQYDYNNKTTTLQTELGVSCMTFIESKKNTDFSLLYEAIERAEMRNDYEKSGRTFLLLTDRDFEGWLVSYRYTSVEVTPKAVLQAFLRSYIIEGEYPTTRLTTSPIDIITLNQDRTIRMQVYKTPSTSSQNLNSLSIGFVRADGSVQYRGATTSNLQPTNGVIHILNARLSL